MSNASLDQPALEDVRVLIVDDHDLFRSGLRNLLEDEGVQIVGEAAAGQEALKIVRELAPDVVLLDIGLPTLNGYETARRMRALPDSRDALIIALTGWGQEEDRRRSREA